MRGPERLYLCVAVAVYGAVSLLWFLVPRLRGELYKEGHAVELLTAWLFAAAAVATVVKVRRAGLAWTDPHLLIAAVSVLCFGEEINWGERELGLKPPKVLWLEIQGLHDLMTLGYALVLEHGSWRSRGATALVALAAIAILALTRHRLFYPLARTILASTTWRLVTVGALLVFLALALDTDPFPWRYVKALEEATELNAAVAFLLAALQIGKSSEPASRPRRP
jgi:hypothetical protein